MLGGPSVNYMMQEVDVAWYGRQCSQFLKAMVRVCAYHASYSVFHKKLM